MKHSTWLGLAVHVALFAGGCSILTSTDDSDLNAGSGADAGTHGSDAGTTEHDAGVPGEDSGPPACPGGCDDGIPCTNDTCAAGACDHMPSDALCARGQSCDAMRGCLGSTTMCTSEADCDDHNACTGIERCLPGAAGAGPNGCVPGTPLACEDAFSCTNDRCDPGVGCVHEANDALCADTVSCSTDRCMPGPSADRNGCTHVADNTRCNNMCVTNSMCNLGTGCTVGVTRSCNDGNPCTDDTCDPASGCRNAPRDEDRDGYAARSVTGATCRAGTDCDDTNAAVNPGAPEICGNGRDDNCNGNGDEACPLPDTCGTAQALTLTAGAATVRHAFMGLSTDYPSECSNPSGAGPDAVYYIDFTGVFDFEINTIGSSVDTVLAVAADCGDFRYACNDDIGAGEDMHASRIWLQRAGRVGAATRLFIMVGAFGSSVAADAEYQINVHALTASMPTCAFPLDISAGGTLVSSGATVGVTSGTCQPGDRRSGLESVASFRSDGGGRFVAISREFTPDVYVRTGTCLLGMETVCENGSNVGGGVSEAALSSSTSGTAFVFVDGATAARQPFVLRYLP